jgi:hypothetical protein
VSSCAGPGESGGPAVTVTDSAGIEIVTSAVPAWQSGGGWSISEAPTLEIGTVSGEDAYSLYRVRGVIRLPDGRIAIANGGTWQIRIYDEHGVHQQDIGRNGDGPGEFRSLRELWLSRGDSMMTADFRLNRVTLFDSEGRLGRTIQISPSGEVRQVFGREPFDDGTLLVSGVMTLSERPRPGLFDGGSRAFYRHSSDGAPLNRIGEQPHGPNWGFTREGSQAYTAATFSVSSPRNASDGVAVYLGAGTSFQVEKRRPTGSYCDSFGGAPILDRSRPMSSTSTGASGYREPTLRSSARWRSRGSKA